MSTPIYQIFVMSANTAGRRAFNALPESRRAELMEKETASRAAVGAVNLLACDSAWAGEDHPYWGVFRFPDIQARIAHTRTLWEIGWLDYVEGFTLLGTSPTEMETAGFPDPIYKLWIIRSNPATAVTGHMAPGLDQLRWEKHNAIYAENGSKGLILCNSSWCNEAYPAFGISAYPSLEANMKVMDGLNALGWAGYFDCVSYLGIKA
jgi:hypothetical protein